MTEEEVTRELKSMSRVATIRKEVIALRDNGNGINTACRKVGDKLNMKPAKIKELYFKT